jgi:hypothetical protein
MQIGDLVEMVGFGHYGILVEIRTEGTHGNHTHRVLFSGTGYEELDGFHWCNPKILEVL